VVSAGAPLVPPEIGSAADLGVIHEELKAKNVEIAIR
jgi:hypothetical protein